MQMRIANMQDAALITALINAAFRKAESFFIDRDRIDVAAVRSLLEKGEFLIADYDGKISGCVYLEQRGERSYLGLLSVDPNWQNSGIGSALMKSAEDRCRKRGSRFMDLRIVNLRTENHVFYQRRGYVETGTEPFPAELNPKRPCHFINMTKPLA